MKIRLFSTLAATLALSTATGLGYTITIPKDTGRFIANQLDNNLNGYQISQVIPNPTGALDGLDLQRWNCHGYARYVFDSGFPTGFGDVTDTQAASPGTLAPGDGAYIFNTLGHDISITFSGNPIVPVLVAPLPCGCGNGNTNLLSRQTPGIGTYENITGRSPQEGSQVLRWNSVVNGGYFITYTFANCLWTPSVPTADVGESVFIFLPCTTNLPCPCPPEPLVLFNTGVDANGARLTNGAVDPHYVLTTNPNGTGSNALVVTGNGLTNSTNSAWLGNGNGAGGTYVYRMTFNLPCTNNPIIIGQWAVDNSGTIQLNGTTSVDTIATLNSHSFTDWHPFAITTGMHAGQNTLDFYVTNSSTSATGLRVELSGTATCCATNPCFITMNCATNKTVSCSTNWNFDAPTNIVDNCCTNYSVTFNDATNSGPCPWVFTRTWLVSDTCGNSNYCSQTVTVTNTPPVITSYPNGGNLGCNPTNLPTDIFIKAQVITTGGCGVTTNVTHVDGGTACSPTRTFTITASNACGSAVVTNVIYTWTVDTTPPTLTCSSNKTVNCGTNWTFDAPAATDNCSGTNVTLTFTTVTNSAFCPLVFTRTWIATDLCGNTNTCSQTVTVINTTLPVFTNCPASLDLGCNPTNIPDRDPNVRAINGCGPATIPSYLLVSSYNTSEVRRYDGNTGTPINTGIFVSAGSGGLNAPGGLAFGVDGNLYVCSRFTSDVKRYNGTTGTPIGSGTFVSTGSGGLNQPVALAFGPDGNLYVSNGGSNNVVRYNGTTGAFMDIFASGVSNPQGVVFGPDGNLYVSSFTTSEVKSYVGPLNPSPGTLIGAFVLAGSGGLNGPVGLVFGPDGNLYVSSDNTHNVKRYAGPLSVSPNPAPGTFLGDFVSLVSAGSGGLVEPLGLMFGPDGNLYVCDRSSAMVKHYNGTTGAFINNFASGPAGFPVFTPSAPVITSTKVDSTNGCSRSRTITYTAVDTCGNSNTCTQLITWTLDTTPPVITGSHAAVALGCNPASLPTDAILKAQVTATDNCGIASTNVTHVDGGTLCASNRTFTITVTDACGNTASTNVVYIWTIDHSLPVITIAPTLLNLNCNPATANLPTDAYVTTLVRATDNCSLASTNVTHLDGGTACASNRTFTITVRDGCTNSASTNLVYTWKVDHTLPGITCLTNKIIVRLNTNCQLVIPPVGVKASDNCTPASQLVFIQSPTNGTIMLVKQMTVTVTVYDACGNSNSCTSLVVGQDQLGPVVSGPTTLAVTNCLMPSVTNLVTVRDNCCPQSSLKKTQSPAPNTPLGPGVYSVYVTVTDCNGNSTPWKIQLTVSPTESFLTNLFNTGVNASRALLPIGAIDPHYTLGPVPPSTLTGLGNYNAPNAIVYPSSYWTLPPIYPSGKSAWIAPSTNNNGYPKGYYVYTNRFTLPVTADAASASISGKWAADNGAKMYFNGSATPIKVINTPNGYKTWNLFTISGGFLPNPAVNTILFVVSNSPNGFFGNANSITGLRVEYTNATANCYTCAPPAIIGISTEQTVPQHGGVNFSVAVSGTPPLSYQWFFNGVPLPDSSPYFGVHSDNLFIKPVDYPLVGIYTVVISNPCGSATAKTKLSVSRGLAWASGVWNVAQPDNPLAATIGPDLNLVGTSDYGMNFALTAGTTEDFELPAPGGQVVNVMHIAPLPVDTSIQVPLIAPPGSNSVNSYTLIMDLYQPTNSAGTPSTLFQSRGCCLGTNGQDGVGLTMDAQNYLHLAGSAIGIPFDVVSAVPLPIAAWNRVAIVIDDPEDGWSINLSLYLNGQNVASLNLLTSVGLPINWDNSPPTLLSRQTNDVSLNGDFYVSSIQFHAIALAPQDIVGMGSPDAGPAPLNESVAGPQPVLAAAVVNGTISFTWTGDLFVLQETADLTGGDWTDSMLPFTESEVNGDTLTTAVANPAIEGSSKFYRLIFRP